MSSTIRKALQTERRERYLQNLVNEAIAQIITEQATPVADPGAGGLPPAAPVAPIPGDPEGLDAGAPEEFTVDDMIERLNVIRGGRSFTDPEVYGQLVTFFKGQSEEQKAGAKDFLMSLGKIVINVNQQEKPGGDQNAGAPPAIPPAPPPAAGPPAPPAPPPPPPPTA